MKSLFDEEYIGKILQNIPIYLCVNSCVKHSSGMFPKKVALLFYFYFLLWVSKQITRPSL